MKPWLPLTSSGSKTARDLLPLYFWADEAVLALKIKDYIVSELQRSSSAEIKQAVCASAPGITARELNRQEKPATSEMLAAMRRSCRFAKQ